MSLALLFAVACGLVEVPCDPATEECGTPGAGAPYRGAPALWSLDWGCCAPGEPRCGPTGAWWVDVVSRGEVAAVAWSLRERPGVQPGATYSESHAVPLLAADPDGWWQNYALTLDVRSTAGCASRRDCAGRLVEGTNTLFACDAGVLENELTAAVTIEGTDGARVACRSWGADAAAVLDCVPVEGGAGPLDTGGDSP